jgi:hypothetical protein
MMPVMSEKSMTDLPALLARFDVADPALLIPTDMSRRFETKRMASTEVVLAELSRWTGERSIVLAGTNRIARYRTLYFDTPSRLLYRDHVRGARPRSKVRIREHLDRELAFLEVKTREPSGAIRKLSRKRDELGSSTLCQQELDFIEEACRHRGRDGRWVHELEPALCVTFERVLLVQRGQSERLTFDFDITFERGERRVSLGDLAIVERKTTSGRRTHEDDANASRGWRRGFSKYCLGSTLLDRDLPTYRGGTHLRDEIWSRFDV